jgi:hypothetical protein
MPDPLQGAWGIDDTYDVTGAVASETSIGAPYVQCDDMPVVQTRHILDKLRAESHLAPVCEWLNKSNTCRSKVRITRPLILSPA